MNEWLMSQTCITASSAMKRPMLQPSGSSELPVTKQQSCRNVEQMLQAVKPAGAKLCLLPVRTGVLLKARVSVILFQPFHTSKMDVIFNVPECVSRDATPCVTLKINARMAKLNSQICKILNESSCFKCMCVCVCVCVCVCRPVIQQFVWVGSLFWFLLFFSPFQCFPPLLCSKDKFGRFAKFITFHLWNPTLFTPPQPPPLPPSPPLLLLLATCTDLLVPSFVPHSSSSVRLGSTVGFTNTQ